MRQVVHQRMLLRRPFPVQIRLHIVVKRAGPRVWRRIAVPFRGAQVVHHVAARHQHDAFIAQAGQLTAHLKMPRRRFGAVDAQLHHRDIRLRVHFDQHAPGTVVKAPGFFVQRHRYRSQQLNQPLREFRGTWRRVMGIVQRLREAAKVMNGLRRFHRRHPRATGKPVRGDHDNRFRARQRLAQVLPGTGIEVIFQYVHGATVT